MGILNVIVRDRAGAFLVNLTSLIQRPIITTKRNRGYDSFTFDLARRNFNQALDIGLFDRVSVYDGLELIWDGELRGIHESQGTNEDKVNLLCLGHHAILNDAPYNRRFSEERFSEWEDGILYGNPAPRTLASDKFVKEKNNRLYMAVKKDHTINQNDSDYWYYADPFDRDITRVVCNMELQESTYGFGVVLYDVSNGAVLVDRFTSGTMTVNISPGAGCKKIRFEIYSPTAGAQTMIGDEGTVYGKITGLTIYTLGTAAIPVTITAKQVAEAVIDVYSTTGLGLSSIKTSIGAPGIDLTPVYFDTDKDGLVAMDYLVELLGSGNAPWQWAIWEDKILVLEAVPLTTIAYFVDPSLAEINIANKAGGLWLKAYGVYKDSMGFPRRTQTYISANAAGQWDGRFRTKALEVDKTSILTKAQTRVQDWLAKNDDERITAEVRVRGYVKDQYGSRVELARIRAGKLIAIDNVGARWASLSATDFRDRRFIFLIAETSYDWESGILNIKPEHPIGSILKAAQIAMQGA